MADVAIERADFALDQAARAGRLAVLGAMVFGATASVGMDWRWALVWTLGVGAALLGRNWLLGRARAQLRTSGGLKRAVGTLWWGSFAMGIAIASLPVLGFSQMSLELRMLLTLFYCCWVAGAMSSLGILPILFMGYSGLLFSGVMAGWLLVRDPFVPAIGIALFLYWIILQAFARNLALRVEESIAIRNKNEELVQQLSQANAALQAANEAKAQFIMSASHDLRQPLHAIGLLSGILAHSTNPADLESARTALNSALTGLNSLFSAVLDLSRLDSGRLQPELRVMPIHTLIGRLDVEYRALCLEGGRRWECQCEQAYARTDPVLLERVLRNLLDNALKHGESGFVRLAVEVSDQSVVLAVSDNGPGVPEHEHERVFDDFYRGSAAGGTRGMGLGLAFARRFAQALGSHLTVEFTDPKARHGARFFMTLPAASESEHDGHAAIEEESQAQEDVRGLRVLLLDDDRSVLDAERRTLSHWGCEVQACQSHKDLQAFVSGDWPPDVAVIDYRLDGGLSGIEAIRPVSERYPEMGVIVVTGEPGAGALPALRDCGFPVLTKPVHESELRRTLNLFKVVNT